MKNILSETFILALPLVVFIAHKTFSGNRITPYFIPRILKDRKYPKAELRQAGTAYCVFAAWLFSFVAVTACSFMPLLERTPFLLGLFFFVFPILFLMCLVIGASYLLCGLFSRDATVKPRLESIDHAQADDLAKYIRKIKIFNTINLSCPVLLIAKILTEESMGIAEKGSAILLNIALLITFIMNLWRIRAYLMKAAVVMDPSPNNILRSTLFSPWGIFFVWIHSFLIIKKFKQQTKPS